MFFKLKQNYIMRGWDKKSWMLIHRPENSYKILDSEEFQLLLLCDGKTDIGDDSFITNEMRITLKKMENRGIVEECEYGDTLNEDQYYRYYDNRFVHSAFWSITGRCNFRCRHCFMDAPASALGEISHNQAMDIIDQMAECGVLRVDITGGEPFVRQDFWQLIDRIQYYKMTIGQIYTNAWFLKDNILNEFEKRNLKPEFSISFDGVGWHDWMRGIKGAEKAALQSLELCNRREFPVNVEMCVHKGNQNTIRETVKLLADIGVTGIKIVNVTQTSLWKENSEGKALSNYEFAEKMIEYIPHFFEDGMQTNVILSNIISLYEGSTEYQITAEKYDSSSKCLERLLCGSARCNCYITPEGRLLPCLPMTACKEQREFPLIQDIGLKQGLSDSFYMKFVDSRVKDLLEVNEKCASCEHKYQCGGGCRAAALQRTGDLMGCDVDQCMLWENGYVDRIRETADKAIAKYCSDTVEAL